MSDYPVQDFIFKNFPWTSIFYAKRHYGYPYRDLIAMWRQAADFDPDKVGFLGERRTQAGEFFGLLADRRYDECETYACVEGRCSVMWHPLTGHVGGFGPAGCPCDNLEDPRDLERGAIA